MGDSTGTAAHKQGRKLSSLFPGGFTAIDSYFAKALRDLTGAEVKLYLCLALHRKSGRLTTWPTYNAIGA